jgi:hypothetical protein
MATLILEGEESLIRGRGKSVLFGPGNIKPVSKPGRNSIAKGSGLFQKAISDWRNFLSLRTPVRIFLLC